MASFAKDDNDSDIPMVMDPISSTVDEEIRKYSEISVAPTSVDALVWWVEHRIQFPLLSNAVKFVFGIPASSAAAERNFSTAGGVVSDKRSALLPKHVDNILLCHGNIDLKNVIDSNVNEAIP